MTALLRPVRQWWTQSNPFLLQESQERLLKKFVRAPFIQSRRQGMNSVEFRIDGDQDNGNHYDSARPIIILAHGFGSGLGFFYNNIDLLFQNSKQQPPPQRVIAVDWMGMGGSDRPSCRAAPIRFVTNLCWCESRFSPRQAVDFFIDPFMEWMKETVLSKYKNDKPTPPITLVGHSLGGYLAARFVWKYHEQVPQLNRLILASPVGFPPRPSVIWTGAQLPTSLRVLDALWSSNVTPQQLVRLFGSTRGRHNVQRALRARMPGLSPDDATILADYLYHITVADASGEFAMNSLLEPVANADVLGVFAREPLQDLMLNNGATIMPESSSSSSSSSPPKLDTLKVLYGDHDWMRTHNEASARHTLQQLPSQTAKTAMVEIVSNAGHHLYLENPRDFVRHIVS